MPGSQPTTEDAQHDEVPCIPTNTDLLTFRSKLHAQRPRTLAKLDLFSPKSVTTLAHVTPTVIAPRVPTAFAETNCAQSSRPPRLPVQLYRVTDGNAGLRVQLYRVTYGNSGLRVQIHDRGHR